MAATLTILPMTKKQGRVGRPKKPENEGRVPLFVEIDPALKKALEGMASKNRRTLTAEVTVIFEQAAKVHGLWPPS
jgi:hypothetical protein